MSRLQSIRHIAAKWLDRLAFTLLILLAFSFALEVLRPLLTVSSWQFSNLEVLQFLLFGVWLLARCVALDMRRPPLLVTGSVVLWLGILLLSSFMTPSYSIGVLAFDTRIVRGVLIGWITFDLTRTVQRWQFIFRALALGGGVVYALGLAEAAHFQPVLSLLEYMRGIAIQAGDLPRISSTLPYPTITAMVIELTLFPAFGLLLRSASRRSRIVYSLIVLAGIGALILTSSRGGLIGLLGGLVVISLIALRRSSLRRLMLIGGAALLGSLFLLIGIFALQNPSLLLRFESENSQSWYRTDFNVPAHVTARPGEALIIPVTVMNTGLHDWTASGDDPFDLSYHLLESIPDNWLGVTYNGERTLLPATIRPGQSVTVQASVYLPNSTGDYLIQWDMVQEHVSWFSTQSAPMGETVVTLAGDPVDNPSDYHFDFFIPTISYPTATRQDLWAAALRMTAAYPVLGVGPDNFRVLYDRYATRQLSDTNVHANSLYVEWLADTGIAGLLAYLLMSAIVLRDAVRKLASLSGSPVLIGQIMLIGSLSAWYIHGLVDYFYDFMPTNTVFWLIVGLVISVALLPKNNSQSTKPAGS